MRILTLAVAAVGGSLLFAAPASAAFPIDRPAAADSGIEQARQGCGPGWALNRWGHCRPMVRPFWPPRRAWARPPGLYDRAAHCWSQRTPRGWRRVCR